MLAQKASSHCIRQEELTAMENNAIRISATLTAICTAMLLGVGAVSAPAAMPPLAAPPAGQYQLDKSHASLQLRVSHLGFSTYTTRFSRFDAELTFDPAKPTAALVVTTIDAASLEMDAAPAFCLDMVRGPQFLDAAKYPKIVFRSERVRMTGKKSMEILGTLDLHGVTRPLVLTATYH